MDSIKKKKMKFAAKLPVWILILIIILTGGRGGGGRLEGYIRDRMIIYIHTKIHKIHT